MESSHKVGKGLKISDTAFLKNSGVTPASFPGLHRWYRADDYSGIAVDGDSIGGGGNTQGPWIDRTGSGDNATAVSGPIFRTNIVGTMPIIRFTGGTGPFMSFAPGALTDFTVIAALDTSPGVDAFICYALGTGHQLRRLFSGADELVFFAGAGVVTSTALVGNVFEVNICKRSVATVNFRKNQTAQGGGVEGTAWTVNQIGYSPGQSIDLGELMIYTTPLSDADLDLLYDQYLKPRWTTLP